MQQQQQHRQQIINVAVGSRNSHGLALIGNSLSLLRSSSTSSSSSSSTPLSLSAAFLDVCSFRTTFLPSSSPNNNNNIHNGGNQKSSLKAWEEAHVLSFSIDSQSPKAAASLSQRTLLSGGNSSTATTTLLLRFTLYLDAESPASFASELDRLEEWKKAYIEIVYSPQGLFFSEDERNSRHTPTTIVLGRSEFTVEGGAKAVILNYEETSGENRGVGIMTTSPNASNSWDYVFWYLRARALLSGMSLVSLPQDWKQPEYASQAYRFALFIARGQTDDVDSASHSAQHHSPLVSNTASRDCYFYATNNASNAIIREQLLKEQMERISSIERTNLMTQTTFDNDAFIKHGCSSSYFAANVPGASDYVKVHRERVKWRRKTSTEPSQSNFTSSSSSSSSSYLSFSDWATNVISSSNVVPPSSSSVGSLLLSTAATNTVAKPRSSSASSLLQPSSSARPPSTPMSAKTPAPPKTNAAISVHSITPLSTPAKASVPLAMNNIASTPIAPRSSILSTSSGKAGIVMPSSSSSSSTPTLVCGNKDTVSSIISSSSSLHPASNVSLSAPVSMSSSSSRRHSTSSAVDIVSSASSSSAVASTPSRSTTIVDPAVITAISSSSTPSSQKPPLKKDAAKFFKEMLKKS